MDMKSYGFDVVPGKVLFETGLYSSASLQMWFELAKSFRNDLEFVLSSGEESVSLVLEKDPSAKNVRERDNVPCVITSMASSKTDTKMDHNTLYSTAYTHVAEIFANPLVCLECRDGIDGIFTREGCLVQTPPIFPDSFLMGMGEYLAHYSRDETSDQKRHFSSEIWRPEQISKFLPIFEYYPEGLVGMDLETHNGTSDQKRLSLLMNNSVNARGKKTPNIVGIKYPYFGMSSVNGRDAFSKAYHSLHSLFAKKNTRGTPVVINGYSHVEDRHNIGDFKQLSCPIVPEYELGFQEFLMEAGRIKDDARRILLQGKPRK